MIKKLFDIAARWMSLMVVAVTAAVLVWPAPFAAIDTWWITPLLGLIMFGMGLTLSTEDLRVVAMRPRDIAAGVVMQYVVMPLTAWALARLLQLPEDVALGVVLVGCCPGGTASNVITYLAKGDLALSVGVTACSTLLAPLVTPLLVWLLVGHSIDVDAGAMMQSIVTIVVLPIVAGLAAQRWLPALTRRAVPYLPGFSSLAIAATVALVVGHSAEKLLTAGLLVIAVVVMHNAIGLSLGYLIARLLRMPYPKRVALSIEVGMQNSGLASGLAVLHFAAFPLAAVPGAVFSVWHNVSGALMAKVYSEILGRPRQP